MNAWIVLALWCVVRWWLQRALAAFRPPHSKSEPDCWPRVTIVAPSRNEEQAVEAATLSLLACDYPNLELVAVNDRSEDATGQLLEGLARADERLKVVHLEHLPDGWLGKNHACHRGADLATGEWLLFTDGDVVHHRSALRQAVAFALEHDLGHLAGMPLITADTFLERCFVTSSLMWVLIRFRCWELERPRTRGYAGLGAFNLIRRAEYEAVGGYQTLAMEMADDMKLGMVLRRSGVRQAMVDMTRLLRVNWMPGFGRALKAHCERALCALEWSPLLGLFPLLIFLILLSPLFLWSQDPIPSLLAILVATNCHVSAARALTGTTGWEGLTQMVMVPLLWTTLVVGILRTYWLGGTTWRGTHYSLEELKRGCVRERDWPLDRVVAT